MHKMFFLGWLAGVLLSISSGSLGTFIVWRRMSSFGNTISHSSLLGLAIAALININSFYVVLLLVIILTVIIVYLECFSNLMLDTILGIITYSSLSLGMIILNIISTNKTVDLTNYLFGDLLILQTCDVIIIGCMSVFVLCVLIYYWRSMISVVISDELSQLHGIKVFKVRLILMLITSLLIGITTKLVGALLITSLLIIPPATVQKFVKSPEQMIFYSIIVSIISITLGVIFSIFCIIPISPIIILFESIIFLISMIL
ncbi:High-affinity zinc uptake system membrane protein ZnuB [Buchnera aphidicola (Phyllaphis fagi)]|uniref:metal ABC transporter permease n=1 Tax=Buchnera aphidicola TaxID=9 RepID=UPI003463D018